MGAPAEPASQEESFTAWRRFLESWAEERPTVLVFEDLHWADEALLSFLEHLADWAEGVPLLVLCTARPELYEQHPDLRRRTLATRPAINLAPLTDEETARLLASLLERAVLPAETQQALLERAGGNPLYAEEFVRLLADRGELRGGGGAGLGAGADRRPPRHPLPGAEEPAPGRRRDRQGVLGGRAGRDGWPRAARGRAGATRARPQGARAPRPHVARWRASTSTASGTCCVRDVCYQQIPRAARAARHRAAAAWIERKAGERVEDLADVLAHHYLQALELARAAGQTDETRGARSGERVRYLALAGERALALDVAQRRAEPGAGARARPLGHPERASLLERWAQAARSRGGCRRRRQALEEALALYRDRARP